MSQRWLGAGFILIISLVWAVWGQKRYRSYFWVHSSAWLMMVLTGVFLYLLFSNVIALWVNGLSFLIISLVLIGWGYRA
jgi:hypothetical protein